MKKINAYLNRIGDALFPRVCHGCGATLGGEIRFVCPSCRSSLPRTGYHRTPDNAMERRFMGRFPFDRATGHFFYSRGSTLAELIHDFKYRGYPGLATELGRFVAEELLLTPFFTDLDVILPVPLHWRKRLIRGYNQSEHIARGISEVTGIRVGSNLRAARYHRTQTSLSNEARRENTEGIFRLREARELQNAGVLLVDDVCTTGATIASAAETITGGAQGVRLTLLTIGVTF